MAIWLVCGEPLHLVVSLEQNVTSGSESVPGAHTCTSDSVLLAISCI